MNDEDKKLPLDQLTRLLAKARGTSLFAIEIKHRDEQNVDATLHATFNDLLNKPELLLQTLIVALKSSIERYECELMAYGKPVELRPKPEVEVRRAGPSFTEQFKKHGISYVAYSPLTLIEAMRAALGVVQRNGERRVTLVGVAALIVWVQAKLADDSIENTIELMRCFIDNLQKDPKVKARA